MNTKQGYIIPIILIIILIILGGVFIFSQKQAESPIIEIPVEQVSPEENIVEQDDNSIQELQDLIDQVMQEIQDLESPVNGDTPVSSEE